MKRHVKVAIIIPSQCSNDSLPILQRCITSLVNSSKTHAVNIKIILVTNGNGESLGNIKKNVSIIIKVKNPYSFTKMNNIAIKKALLIYNPEWVLLINDDAYVSQSYFKYLTSSKSKKSVDIVVPLIYNNNEKSIDSFGVEYFISGHAKNSNKLNIKTQLATASCLLINTDILHKIKLRYGFYFNTKLISYLEDVEFSIRALAIGANMVKNKKMVAYHEGSYSNGKKSNYVMYQSYKNLIWIIIMTWPKHIIINNILNIIIVQIVMFILSLRLLNPWIYFKIWPSTLKNLPQLLITRKKTISSFNKDFDFKKIFSPYVYRNSYNIKIKFLNIV